MKRSILTFLGWTLAGTAYAWLAFTSPQAWILLIMFQAAAISLMVLFSSNSFAFIGRFVTFFLAFLIAPWMLPVSGPVAIRSLMLTGCLMLMAFVLFALQQNSSRNLACRYALAFGATLFVLTLPKMDLFLSLGLLALCALCFSLHDQGIQPFGGEWIQKRKLERLERQMEEARQKQKLLQSYRPFEREEDTLSSSTLGLVE